MTNGLTTDRMLSILVFVVTIQTIVYNVFVASGSVNAITPEVISNLYPTVLTPAGYAFSIWSLIYTGLFAFSIYQLLPRNLSRFRSIRTLYVISGLLNCTWLFFWHNDQIGICLIVILALLATLFLILREVSRDAERGAAIFTKFPFGLYAGWVTAASLINFVVFLTYMEVKLGSRTWNLIGVALILFAAGVAAAVRWRLKNYIFPLSIAWAATAIAIKQSSNTAIIVAAAICVIICLVLTLSFVMDQKTFDYENG